MFQDIAQEVAQEAFKVQAIKTLMRQAQRYHYASLQDKNPIVAARHNGYAVALIDAVRDLATEEEVYAIMKVSLQKLRAEILAVQDKIEGKAIELLESLQKKGIKLPF